MDGVVLGPDARLGSDTRLGAVNDDKKWKKIVLDMKKARDIYKVPTPQS